MPIPKTKERSTVAEQDLRISQTETLDFGETLSTYWYPREYRVAYGKRLRCNTEKRVHHGPDIWSNGLRSVGYCCGWNSSQDHWARTFDSQTSSNPPLGTGRPGKSVGSVKEHSFCGGERSHAYPRKRGQNRGISRRLYLSHLEGIARPSQVS